VTAATAFFAMGRPKGSRNKAGHKAGGDRRSLSESRKAKDQTSLSSFLASGTERQSLPSSTTLDQDAPVSAPAWNPKVDSDSLQAELWEAEHQRLKATREKLKEVLNHPSMKVAHELDSENDEDCDSYLSDNDDDDNESGSDSGQSADTKKYRRSYLPPKGSVVSEYLSAIKDKVMKGTLPGFNLDNGQKWIPPQSDAISIGIGNRPAADRWYLGRIWIYVWMPLRQYGRQVGGLHPCPFCGQCNTHSQGLYWRPMFFHSMIVFVLHQRFRCKNPQCCGSSKGK
jgi:hypothetical protein